MSHELRTPLNAILGFGQILDQGALEPLAKESVGHILKGGRHLLGLINEVLDLARVEAGGLELSIEPVSIRDAVQDACSLVCPLAEERGIQLRKVVNSIAATHVLADAQRLKQVLINLLSNGIKYNHPNGTVEVTWSSPVDGRVLISIRDTGPGIPPEDMAKLFQPFERLSFGNSIVEGTGLGLTISQRLMAAMGGRVVAESTLGLGSTFSVELASAAEPQLKFEVAAVEDADSREPNMQEYTILAIEDNLSNLRLLEVILARRPGITILPAMQGSVGLDLARQFEPDLILLDMNLPDMSGTQVLAALRASGVTKTTPVVIVSADATPSQAERLLLLGASHYLTKPLNVSEFLSVVERFLPDKQLIEALPAAL